MLGDETLVLQQWPTLGGKQRKYPRGGEEPNPHGVPPRAEGILNEGALSLTLLVYSMGCAHPAQRFVPLGDNAALDTKTGGACNPFPLGKGPVTLPYCSDLYRQQ
jgi:hypothetical protein